MEDKTQTDSTLVEHNKSVAGSAGYRMESLRCGKGECHTTHEYDDTCLNLGISLEIAVAVATPQQIGLSKSL